MVSAASRHTEPDLPAQCAPFVVDDERSDPPGTVCPMFGDASTVSSDGSGGGEAILSRALERFGHASLRPGQADVIADIFNGRPVIAVMPTGAGKSLCYQLPAIVLGERGGVTLVVSPLI